MSAGANCATAASASVPMDMRLGAFGARWKKPYAPNNTPRMATRRVHRMTAGEAMPAPASAPRHRHNIGSTRSLLIMVASAMLATITMPVAAENPPRYAISASQSWPCDNGSHNTHASATGAPRPAASSGNEAATIGTTTMLSSRR